MTEAEFTRDVIAEADQLGLLWHHCPDSRRCKGNRGFPDLVIAGRRGLILAELKTQHGERDAPQDLWGWTLTQPYLDGGQLPYRLWRPASLENGWIAGELRKLR